MGYTTEFKGCLWFNKQPDKKLIDYVNKFSSTRRMKRDNDKIKELYPDWEKDCLDGELGTDGEFFLGGEQDFDDKSVVGINTPPSTQPGLWCQWVIEKSGLKENDYILCWDGGEKFYHYVEWLRYLIDKIFTPRGYVLNGEIRWRGEEFDDMGTIYVNENFVSTS